MWLRIRATHVNIFLFSLQDGLIFLFRLFNLFDFLVVYLDAWRRTIGYKVKVDASEGVIWVRGQSHAEDFRYRGKGNRVRLVREGEYVLGEC